MRISGRRSSIFGVSSASMTTITSIPQGFKRFERAAPSTRLDVMMTARRDVTFTITQPFQK